MPGAQKIPQPELIHLDGSFESIQIDVHAGERRGAPVEAICLHECVGRASNQAADAAGTQEGAHAGGLARAQIAFEIQAGARPLGAGERSGEGDAEGFRRGSVGQRKIEIGDCHAI